MYVIVLNVSVYALGRDIFGIFQPGLTLSIERYNHRCYVFDNYNSFLFSIFSGFLCPGSEEQLGLYCKKSVEVCNTIQVKQGLHKRFGIIIVVVLVCCSSRAQSIFRLQVQWQ